MSECKNTRLRHPCPRVPGPGGVQGDSGFFLLLVSCLAALQSPSCLLASVLHQDPHSRVWGNSLSGVALPLCWSLWSLLPIADTVLVRAQYSLVQNQSVAWDKIQCSPHAHHCVWLLTGPSLPLLHLTLCVLAAQNILLLFERSISFQPQGLGANNLFL